MTDNIYLIDPLQEKKYEILPGLIWKYPNRVLLLTTLSCPFNCDFCFRKNLYKKDYKRAADKRIIDFVKQHKEIREFIFSGGEPLTEINDIFELVKKLVLINHIKIFRVHSRLPILAPEKVNFSELKRIAKLSDKPWYFVLHVNTPEELANQKTRKIIIQLRKIGFILLSHTVFLKKINDDVDVLEKLFTNLVELGVKPYYIFHCDNLVYTKKYIVPLEKEIKIITELRKKLTGIANPTHVVDSASGQGKIPVPSNFWQFNPRSYKDFFNSKNNS